jgi:hypothetical protein
LLLRLHRTAERKEHGAKRDTHNVLFHKFSTPFLPALCLFPGLFDSQFPLRFSKNREIADFSKGDLTIDFHNPFAVVEQAAEAVLRHATVEIEPFDKRIIGPQATSLALL